MSRPSPALPPIPIPPRLRWQAFCREWMPWLVFGVGVVLVVQLWEGAATAPSFVAEAEAQRAEVRPLTTGVLANVSVAVGQPVQAGQVVGHLITTDPQLMAARLAVLRAELEMLVVTMQPALDQQRVALDYERLQLDLMRQRVELAALRANLSQAETSLSRIESLRRSQGVAEQMYDEAVIRRDRYAEQVDEQMRLLEQLDPALRQLNPAAHGPAATPQEALRAAIRVQEERLRLIEAELSPVPLLAPADGVVASVQRRPGEVVTRGEPILQIVSPHSERLVGFVRQPVQREPEVGSLVEVRTRGASRRRILARVEQVGAAMEPIMPTLLAAMRLSDSAETGLRVQLSLPESLGLRPGEQVDVVLRRGR